MTIEEPTQEELEKVTGPQVIACIARELALRKKVYPRLVACGKMKPDKARSEIAAMSVALTLARLTYEPIAPLAPPIARA